MRQQEFRRRKRKPRKSARSEIVFGARDWHQYLPNIHKDILNGSVSGPLTFEKQPEKRVLLFLQRSLVYGLFILVGSHIVQ